jgi:pentatricopeptide repeat protein
MDKVKEVTLYLLNLNDTHVYSLHDIQYHIIFKNHCDVKEAEQVLEQMKELGLELCNMMLNDIPTDRYDIKKFAGMRGWGNYVMGK